MVEEPSFSEGGDNVVLDEAVGRVELRSVLPEYEPDWGSLCVICEMGVMLDKRGGPDRAGG